MELNLSGFPWMSGREWDEMRSSQSEACLVRGGEGWQAVGEAAGQAGVGAVTVMGVVDDAL